MEGAKRATAERRGVVQAERTGSALSCDRKLVHEVESVEGIRGLGLVEFAAAIQG